MARVEVLLIPDLRRSVEKAIRFLESKSVLDLLLLDFPQTLERSVSKLAEYEISYEEFIRRIRRERTLPEPLESWTYLAEPILRVLPRLKLTKPELEVRCYTPAEAPFSYSEDALKIARLAYRAKATGKLDASHWKNTIMMILTRTRTYFEKAVTNVLLRARGRDVICFAGLDAFRLKRRIAEYLDRVTVRSIEPLYHRTPLEILLSCASRGDVNDDQVSMLALAHVEYLYEYVLRSRDRDEAHDRWVKQTVFAAKTQPRMMT